jgi:phosphate transport system permease protein
MIKRRRKIADKAFRIIAFSFATIAILLTLGIIWFVLFQGIRPFIPGNRFGTYSAVQFLTGSAWQPRRSLYGIGYMIISTLVATFWAVIIAVPIALGSAVFIAEIAPKWLTGILQFFIECLAGIPSIFFGIFGFIVLRPLIERISPYPHGDSILAVIILLTAMTLPTMCLIMLSAFKSIPIIYKESSFALGASKRQSIISPLIPAARSGIVTGIMLGATRAIGETMAVSLVAGNRESGVLRNPFQTVRLLTTNIVMEQSYATELHAQLLWSTAIILLIFIIVINLVLKQINKSKG